MKVPTFEITFGGNRSIVTTKEFIFHEDDIDFSSIPVSPEQLKEYEKFLTKESLQILVNPLPRSPLLNDFIDWRNKLQHTSFADVSTK